MSSARNTNDLFSLNSVALEVFKTRCLQPGISPQQIAIDCFRFAKAFITAMETVASEGIPNFEEDPNPLNGAFAPNLKRTHPVNLMSKNWGDLKQLETVLAHLEAEPSADSYAPLEWGRPEVNQARALFPGVVNRVKQFAVEK